MESEEYSAAEEAVDSYVCVDPMLLGKSDINNDKNSMRKRRFSDEQIKSLECMFESQTKLEPREKLQLARELGLQPRQVAIWFQNKRARWKSKQLEREYSALRADYDALLSSFESVKKEKQSLLKQLQKLAGLLEKPPEGNSDGGDSDNGDDTSEGKELRKPTSRSSTEGSAGGEEKFICGCPEKQEPARPLCMGEPADGSLTLADHQRCCFDPGGCFSEQSCSGSTPWWEFWSLNQ